MLLESANVSVMSNPNLKRTTRLRKKLRRMLPESPISFDLRTMILSRRMRASSRQISMYSDCPRGTEKN